MVIAANDPLFGILFFIFITIIVVFLFGFLQ